MMTSSAVSEWDRCRVCLGWHMTWPTSLYMWGHAHLLSNDLLTPADTSRLQYNAFFTELDADLPNYKYKCWINQPALPQNSNFIYNANGERWLVKLATYTYNWVGLNLAKERWICRCYIVKITIISKAGLINNIKWTIAIRKR